MTAVPASAVRLRCISPLGARDLRHVPEVARIVEVGEEITVPAEVAGVRAGTYRPPTEAELEAYNAGILGGIRTRGDDTGPDGEERPLQVRDPGTGLLGQPEHWEPLDGAPDVEPDDAPAADATPSTEAPAVTEAVTEASSEPSADDEPAKAKRTRTTQ